MLFKNEQRQLIEQNQKDSQQSQPNAIVKFIVYRDQDTKYGSDTVDSKTNAKRSVSKTASIEYVVTNDILNIAVASSKTSPILSAEMTLASGDLNYMSILSPGDHCLIWLLNDRQKMNDLSIRIRENQKANEYDSGLKFVGRINSVRAVYGMSASGIKTIRFLVTLKGFSEFQSQIYYNPLLYQPNERGGAANGANAPTAELQGQISGLAFIARISNAWKSLIPSKGELILSPQRLVPFFVNLFLGFGPGKSSPQESPSEAFIIPSTVAKLLGLSVSKATVQYAQILRRIIGIQKYQNSYLPSNATFATNQGESLCKAPIKGAYLALPESFSGQSIWQIIQSHLNSYLNEMYVSIKPNASGDLFPTLVARQIPFTSQQLIKKFKNKIKQHTAFAELPRWVLSADYPISSFNIGTSDSLRFNFIQVYGAMLEYPGADPARSMQAQIANGNYSDDRIDIARHGVKMQVLNTNLDLVKGSTLLSIRDWTALIGDFYHNGHLKLNGSITAPGIQLPICIGDNLEFDGRLFHIEGVSHVYNVEENTGQKGFYTTIQLSNGVLADGQDSYNVTQPNRRDDMPDQIAPGFTDTAVLENGQPLISKNKATDNSGKK